MPKNEASWQLSSKTISWKKPGTANFYDEDALQPVSTREIAFTFLVEASGFMSEVNLLKFL
jgi:hypothetical protein